MSSLANQKLFRLCCNVIVQHGREPALNWVVNSAKAGLSMTNDEEIRVQILYILNGIQHWRGAAAKAVRQDLKKLSIEFGN